MKRHYAQGRELAAKGRHGDTMLLHVSPTEVHGLASLGALTGRRVTINPTTGLPEAFNFASFILPTLAAIGVSLIPGAAPFAPLAAAAAAGGTTAVQGGDVTDILKSAAMSGIGSLAGSGLAEGLSGLGAAGTAGAAPGAFPTIAGVEAATKLAATPAEKAAVAALPGYATWGASPGDLVPSTVAAATPAAAVAPGAAAAPQTFAGKIDAVGTQFGNIGRAFTGNTSEAFKYLGQNPLRVAGAVAPMLFGGYTPDDTKGDKEDEDDERPRREGFGTMMPPQVKSFPGADYNPDSGDWRYFPTAGRPPAPPVTPAAGNYFASGGGSVPSGLRAMPARRMASGGELDTYLDALRRPYGESPYVPMADYTPSYVASSTGRTAPGDTSDAPAPEARRSDGGGGDAGESGGPGPGGPAGPGSGGSGNSDGDPGGPAGHGPGVGGNDSGGYGGYGDPGGPAGHGPGVGGNDSGGSTGSVGGTGGNANSGNSSGTNGIGGSGADIGGLGPGGGPGSVGGSAGMGMGGSDEGPNGVSGPDATSNSNSDGYGGYGGDGGNDAGGYGGDASASASGPGEAEGGLITLRKAAGGRAADNSDHFGMTAGLMAEARAALLGEHDDPRRALARFESVFGGEALQILRDKIGGGRIRGAGGGLDDLIPGTIEGKQRVRLADGEFVVPADVVSGIGDGSTDQGVRKLHEMMTNVRGERTGKRTQPKRLREGALIV